ncbi:MAG: phosphodiester glycosidase family protein [Armatimonadetes bacterium]|nr:phosphodiester glycosidase family protein [Armatimonadota bacterium]MDW8028817.1 phosphodiester glycosidase family protein [Armatimonadota bacterium]
MLPFWFLICLAYWLTNFSTAQDWQVVESQTIAPGVFFQALQRTKPPTWVGVVRIPITMPKDLSIMPAIGDDGGFSRRTLSQIANFIQQRKGYVTAGINADYFGMNFSPYSGDPLGLQIQDGELLSLPWSNRSALVGLADGQVAIARFQFWARIKLPDGSEFNLDGLNQSPPKDGFCLFTPAFGKTTKTTSGTIEVIASANLPLRPNTPLLLTVVQVNETGDSPIPFDGVVLVATGRVGERAKALRVGEKLEVLVTIVPSDANFDPKEIVWAVSGGPRLLRDGQISIECEHEGFPLSFRQTKHPRTAVGLKEDALIWVVVDGRQPGYSEGMSLDELAEFLRNIGCKDALNLDGGGSSTLLVRGKVVNRPSDGRERAIANSLLLLNLFPPQPIVKIWISAPDGHWLAGTPIPLQVSGEDAVYRIFNLNPDKVELTVNPEIKGWLWDGQNFWLPEIQGEEPVQLTVTAKPKEGNALPSSLTLCLHPKASIFLVRPETIATQPGTLTQLRVEAFGREKDGRLVPILFDQKEIQWRLEGDVGEVKNGVFIATRTTELRQGKIIANLRGTEAVVTVCVGKTQWQTLHEFDGMEGIEIVGYPETTKAEGRIVTQEKRSGLGSLMLRYDFLQGGKTRTASVVLNKTLPANSCKLALDVYGDGNGCWLRARLRDAAGKLIFVDLANAINWKGEWRQVEALLPSGLTEPITLEAVYLAVIRDEQKCQGFVLFDNLRVGMSGF